MKNERKTENIVRKLLDAHGFYLSDDVVVEEQQSSVDAIKKLLKSSSKTGAGGKGSPEFIISSSKVPDLIIVIECKADTKDHLSNKVGDLLRDKPNEDIEDEYFKRVKRYAVDGALHYAKALSREFNVIAVGVSGQTKSELRVSTYLHTVKSEYPSLLTTKAGAGITSIIGWDDYVEHATFDPRIQKLRLEQLMSFAEDLHVFMRDHAKLTENQKPLLVSGTLIALRNKAFAVSYHTHTPEKLQREWMRVIKEEIISAELPEAKKDNMVQPYSGISVHPELGRSTKQFPRGILYELIKELNDKVWPFISVYHDFDVVGQFYGEFLKYTGGDKKSLGIVLTPRHVTELFALLANVHKESKVLDICAGTGGFLVSAMHHMMKDAQTESDRNKIKSDGLVGVEQQPDMFALAASNMILRGDGKANLYQGSCFDAGITEAITKHGCSVGMLNPPFSQSDESLHELYFTKHMLDCLVKGGCGIAIVPMSCAISPHPAKAELLKHHTLDAVMSMPDSLFYPVGTITCIMIFTAKIPHLTSNKKTWFGYWKNDGYSVVRHRGRIDPEQNWLKIREKWVSRFRNKETEVGFSVLKHVAASDEWCAEAYLETDYKCLGRIEYEKTVKRFLLSQLFNEFSEDDSDAE